MTFKDAGAGKIASQKALITNALEILSAAGVKTDDLSKRRLEKMAMSFLAVANMRGGKTWQEAASPADGHILKTRDIIDFINASFDEKISRGSYDDIRRKDLLRPVLMGLIVKSANNRKADTNDGTRGYAISKPLSKLARSYGTLSWESSVKNFVLDEDFIKKMEGRRNVDKLEVILPSGSIVRLDDGPHNQIQKAIVEDLLPRFGYRAEVLYIGDTSAKKTLKNDEKMQALGMDIADRGMLPDIVAFSQDKGWVYLIEAVHSSNPLNPERCIELSRTVLKDCKHGVVFITAFLTKKDFIKWATQIAWETEVWIAAEPDHMIHFNGDKFIGPHTSEPHLS